MNFRSPFAMGVALIVIGIVCFVLQPIVFPEPEARCVPDGQPSSGFVDEELGCNISIESLEEIRQWATSPKPLAIAGSVLVLAGIVVLIVAVVRRRRGSGPPPGA